MDGLVQERRKSITNALDLRLSCTNRAANLCKFTSVTISYNFKIFSDISQNLVFSRNNYGKIEDFSILSQNFKKKFLLRASFP